LGKGEEVMICKRCGSDCPERPEGYCLHCLVGTDIEKALSDKVGKPITLSQAGVDEGFPDWQKPSRKSKLQSRIDRQLELADGM